MFLNKALIIGNLTRDPELKALPSGFKVCNLSVATNRVFKDKEGNKKEVGEFHNVVVFNRQAELVAQYLKKGQSVLVEGRIQTRSWDANDGQKRYRTEIVAENVQFGSRVGGSGPGAGSQKTESGAENQEPAPSATGDEKINYPQEEINPEDIPF